MLHQGATTIQDAFELFLLDIQARGLAASSLIFYKVKVAPFLCWCEGQQLEQLPALTSVHIRKFLVHLQQQTYSNRYCFNIAKAVQTFLNYCVKDELLAKSPFDKVKPPKLEKRIPPAFSLIEIKQIFKACSNARDQAICCFLLDSGLRASELLTLNGEDVDLQTGVVTVRHCKGGKDRIAHIGAKMRKLMRRYYMDRGSPKAKEAIFISLTSGERLTFFGLAQLMERLGKASRVPICTCHTF
jgi:integrase/recombinase XerD